MKTKLLNGLMITSLHLLLIACSKTETSDMMFKEAVSEASSATPAPGESSDPTEDPSVVIVNDEPKSPETVVVTVPPTTSVQQPPAVQQPPVVVVEQPPVQQPPVQQPPVQQPPAVVVQQPPVVVVEQPPVEQPPAVVVQQPPVVVVEQPPVQQPPAVVPPVVVIEQPPVQQPPVVVQAEPEVIYPESEVPVCKFDVTISGLGSAAKVVIASAPKADHLNSVLKGFEALPAAKLTAMRTAIESMKSNSDVLFLTESAQFDKAFFKNNSSILVVVQSKSGKVIDMSGLGKDAQIYMMIVTQEHNTVCLATNGNSSMGELSVTAQTTSKFAARASVFVSGNGSIKSYIKVSGGHRSGSRYEGQAIKDSSLALITEGKDDTFSEIKGNGISGSEFDIKIKGNDKTGFGMKANFVNTSKMRMEIQGEDDVKAMMNVQGKMVDNEVSGWLKAKSGGKVDPLMEDTIELMPLP